MNKSKCCNTSVKDKLTIEGETDFEGKTNYYVCDECGKPCDIINMNNKQSWEEAWEEQFGGYWAIPMASDIDIKAMGGFKTEREAWEWIRTIYFCELCKQENEPLGCSRCECEWMVSDDKIDGHKEIKQFISALLDKREAEIRKETIKAVLEITDKGFDCVCSEHIKDLAKEKINITL